MDTNNQKGFANIVLIVVIVAIVAVGGYFVFTKKEEAPKEGLSKAEMVHLITNVQMLSLDLKNYYKLRKGYPLSLAAFIGDDSYSERSFFISEDQINNYQYIISSDRQHFVIYTTLLLSKDKIGLVNGRPIDTVAGNVLGVVCSDPKIFCSTD